jgi:hypothetical protein
MNTSNTDSCRAFNVGQYVTTPDGLTGYIFEDNGSYEDSRPYRIAICERDEERSVSASEVALWVPKADELEPTWSD